MLGKISVIAHRPHSFASRKPSSAMHTHILILLGSTSAAFRSYINATGYGALTAVRVLATILRVVLIVR
jgi:hypothetical protein